MPDLSLYKWRVVSESARKGICNTNKTYRIMVLGRFFGVAELEGKCLQQC